MVQSQDYEKKITNSIGTAEIISVGTELLLGQIVNTNAAYLASRLSELGINCYRQSVVGDNPHRMAEIFLTALERADLVIATGGLGPTEDDITMSVAAAVAGRKMIVSEDIKADIDRKFAAWGQRTPSNNYKQALLPEGCSVLGNSRGTAPGAIIAVKMTERTAYIIVLPGPPGEMQPMFQNFVKPWLEARAKYRFIHRYIHTVGIGESALVEKIEDIIHNQDRISIAPYASAGEVMLRLTLRIERNLSVEPFEAEVEELLHTITRRIGDYVYSEQCKDLIDTVKDLLMAKSETVSFAESCTGGLLAAKLTEKAGASEVFKGGIVAYSNAVKESLLQVDSSTLVSCGAVSREVALDMARNCRRILASDYAISVTGIAGPGGGSPEKPVGTVWIGYADAETTDAHKFVFKGSREDVRKRTLLNSYNILRRGIADGL